MNQPWLIGIASLIPGLGFWLMGQRQRAAQAFAAVMLAGIIAYVFSQVAPTPPLREASWNILYFAWIMQGYLAVGTARLLQKRAKNPNAAAKGTAVSLETDGKGDESKVERIYTYVTEELDEGEALLTAFEANIPAWEEKSWGRVQDPFRTCYVGLTKKEMLILEVDFSGIPMTVERIPREHVEKISFKPGWRGDTIILDVVDGAPMTIRVPALFREELEAFLDELEPGE